MGRMVSWSRTAGEGPGQVMLMTEYTGSKVCPGWEHRPSDTRSCVPLVAMPVRSNQATPEIVACMLE